MIIALVLLAILALIAYVVYGYILMGRNMWGGNEEEDDLFTESEWRQMQEIIKNKKLK